MLEAFKPGTAPPDSYSVIGYDGADEPRRRSACRRKPTARSAAAGCISGQFPI